MDVDVENRLSNPVPEIDRFEYWGWTVIGSSIALAVCPTFLMLILLIPDLLDFNLGVISRLIQVAAFSFFYALIAIPVAGAAASFLSFVVACFLRSSNLSAETLTASGFVGGLVGFVATLGITSEFVSPSDKRLLPDNYRLEFSAYALTIIVIATFICQSGGLWGSLHYSKRHGIEPLSLPQSGNYRFSFSSILWLALLIGAVLAMMEILGRSLAATLLLSLVWSVIQFFSLRYLMRSFRIQRGAPT